MNIIFCFRLPELVDGEIICAAVANNVVLTIHKATREAGIREAMGFGTIYLHHVYDNAFGRGEWTLKWHEAPTPDMLNIVRRHLGEEEITSYYPKEKTREDLSPSKIEEAPVVVDELIFWDEEADENEDDTVEETEEIGSTDVSTLPSMNSIE